MDHFISHELYGSLYEGSNITSQNTLIEDSNHIVNIRNNIIQNCVNSFMNHVEIDPYDVVMFVQKQFKQEIMETNTALFHDVCKQCLQELVQIRSSN